MTTSVLDIDLRYEECDKLQLDDGVSLYYESRSSGPVITAVNSFFVIAPMWRAFTANLAQQNRIIAYDMRNQGSSSPVECPTWAQHVDDLRHVLDGLEVERTYLVATSIASLVCRDFHLANPDRVAGMILLGPVISPYGGGQRRAVNRSWLTTLEKAGPAALWDQLWATCISGRMIESGGSATYIALREAFVSLMAPEPLRTNLESAMEAQDDPVLLGRINCPTLLIAGDDDFMSSPSAVEEMSDMIPDCETLILPGVGHLPYWEATEEFERATQAFIDKCEARR
jgi:pimeloyl-ACP methyl ester carboxylesterase